MRRVRFLPVLLVSVALAIPSVGGAGGGECQGSLCAGAGTEGRSAYADWNGGHIDFGRSTSRFWRGGLAVQDNADSWIGISLWDQTGNNYFNCWYGPLPEGAFTENADGSWTLIFTDLGGQQGCSANITWRPSDDLQVLNSGHWSRFDPNSGGFEATLNGNLGRPAIVSGGIVAGSTIGQDSWGEMQEGFGACVTNNFCGF